MSNNRLASSTVTQQNKADPIIKEESKVSKFNGDSSKNGSTKTKEEVKSSTLKVPKVPSRITKKSSETSKVDSSLKPAPTIDNQLVEGLGKLSFESLEKQQKKL